METKGQMGGGTLEWVGFRSGCVLPLGDSQPNRLHVTSRGIFRRIGILMCNSFYKVIMFFREGSQVGKVFFEGLVMKCLQPAPHRAPHL